MRRNWLHGPDWICVWSIALLLVLDGSGQPSFAAGRCDPSILVVDDASSQAGLRRIIDACPDHAPALNNLAVLLENAGKFEEAGNLYNRAISADPNAIAPYAGLGDVLRAQGKPMAAASAYNEFLNRLEQAKASGTAGALARHEQVYRDRLAKLDVSPSAVVGAQQIARSLTSPPIRTRGLSLQGRSEPHINIHIRFDFDSARLLPGTEAQIAEIAKALETQALSDRYIVIEGHTDSLGTESYNRKLSIRRAAAVRLALMAHGVAGHRLSALGFGEGRPIADNRSTAGQAQNRRVTFVNMGKR